MNTSFFHCNIQTRRACNKLLEIEDVNRGVYTIPVQINNAFDEYYISFLGTQCKMKKVYGLTIHQGPLVNAQHITILEAPIQEEEIKQAIFGIPGTKAPDDLILFCKGDYKSMVLLLRAFKSFSEASGLHMNTSKSNVYFNGVNQPVNNSIVTASSIQQDEFPFKYLGVPIGYQRYTQ
ncbi:hypothetical protein vseg_005997 [Gypsophila vaccaria]